MSRFIFKAPFNSLSFGQVSYNLTREFYKAGADISIHPIGDNVDLSAFDKIDATFFQWFKESIRTRYDRISAETPTLQLWHLRGSDNRPTNKSILFTFHEINGATETEKAITRLHERVLFSSKFSQEIFTTAGASNVYACPIGFDKDIVKLDGPYFNPDIIHFGLIGKWEKRKNTERIIKNWCDLFGNKKQYRLTCLVENPFFSADVTQQLIRNVFGGKNIYNVTFLPRLRTNSEVNDLYNAIDIDLSGLSSAEGWNLPAFNATCLGKWSCVSPNSSHLDWATKENCILLDAGKIIEPYDGMFFKKGDEFNQGTVMEVSDEAIRDVLNRSISFAKKPNPDGEKLATEFTYKKTADYLRHVTLT